CKPIVHNIHNFVLRLTKQEHTAPTSAKQVKLWMKEFTQEAGNVGGMFVDTVNNKNIATCITLQTIHMREIFDRFPEVVMIDATHGANSSKYKIFSIMARDSFGKGQFVQHAVCILIDKDFVEISVLTTSFPNVTLLLCQFHALKYLHCAKGLWVYVMAKERLDGIVNLLVYARTEREFLKIRFYLRHTIILGSGSTRELGAGVVTIGTLKGMNIRMLLKFISQKRDNCRKMWCSFERQNACTLGNNTNNRLEASWKQFKEPRYARG
ncbi:LOW QUALITY PROTEIN: hypothetical protein PHMEG_00039830, partial [Phytophthora megakarya]